MPNQFLPPVENPIPEPNPIPVRPDEPIEPAPIQTEAFSPTETLPEAVEAPTSVRVRFLKDDNPANEPLKPAPTPENTLSPENPNINVERHGNDVTITEVMEKPEVSKMPFDTQTSKGFLRGLYRS